MSCLHTRWIYNPTKSFVDGVSDIMIGVSCNECEECRKAKRQEWSLRAYIEIRDYFRSGGFTLFPTLTYNNANLPYFNSDRDKGYHIPCFNGKHIKKFMNNLRKRYERRGITGIKYLICAEYGEKKQRPHYHVLLHFPSGCNREQAIKDIHELWYYGDVRWSDYGKEVIGIKGAQYCTKYITKDLNYSDRKDIRSFLHPRHTDLEERKEEIKEYLPKHWQSQGYGIGMIEDILSSTDSYDLIRHGLRIYLSDEVYKIPNYIKNKLMYRFLDNHRYLSKFGVGYKEYSYDYEIEEGTESVEKLLSYDGLKMAINDEDCSKFSPYVPFKDVLGMSEYIIDFMRLHNIGIKDVVAYQKCLRGKSYIVDDRFKERLDVLSNIVTDGRIDYDLFQPNLKIYYCNVLRLKNRLDLISVASEDSFFSNKKNRREYQKRTFNTLDIFEPYEFIVKLIYYLRELSTERVDKYQIKREKVIKKLKELFKN